MIPALLLSVTVCAAQPEAALGQFEVAFREALGQDGPRAILTMEKDLPWKAVTYIDKELGLRTKVSLGWVCSADLAMIVHVARHEVCHIRLHMGLMRREVPLSDEDRIRAEAQAEACVMLTDWGNDDR